RKNSTQTTLLHVEQSGMEAFAIDQIFNRNDTLRVGNSELSKFFALSYDWSRVRRFNLNNALAIRLFGGIVTPFGDSEVVPFVKQYNAGGPNSVRAWRLYELGPGSFRDPRLDEPGNTQNVIQSGEVKLEANLEYRFDLFWRLKSALFIDAGNIWTLDDDADRPGSTISSDWYKQLAIGTGVGFRFDFTYFIFRVDVGWKARTPYENDNGKHWNLNSLSDFSKRSNRYTSIALGYPF
ncbi:MAG: outer membrane protein assembly factor, partial [Bacteroidia bacterium]|nr:outer membrane protein assembly factor [Bacteroidia bacterium]